MRVLVLSLFLCFSSLVIATEATAEDALRVIHEKVVSVKEGESIQINANIINAHRVNYVLLHYKGMKDQAWVEKEMKPKDGFYHAEINVENIHIEGMFYYIEVIDIENKSLKGFGSKEEPAYIDVVENEVKKIVFNDIAEDEEDNKAKDAFMIQDELASFLDEEDEEKVVTASKYAQTRASAPANISIVTKKEIKEYGYHSLLDILRDYGFDVNDNGSWGDIGLRGINDGGTYGKHLLFFVDGHNMSFTQFYRNFISEGIVALEDIKRIEIQRGPGSSIWGANALLGVISIVTEGAKAKNTVSTSVGTHHTYKSHMRFVKEINKDVYFMGSASTYQDDVSKDMRMKEWSEEAGKDVRVNNMAQDSYTLLGKLKLWDFNIESYYHRYVPYAPISTFSVGGENTQLGMDRFFTSLNFDKEVIKNKSVSMSMNITTSYDRYQFIRGAQFERNPYDTSVSDCYIIDNNGTSELKCGSRELVDMEAKDDRYEAKGYTTLRIEPINTTLLAGFEFEHLRTKRWHFLDEAENYDSKELDFTQNNIGAFLQAEINMFKMISLVSGLRYDKSSVYNAQLSPKVSLVIFPGNFFIKGIWGKGFRAASLHELYFFRKDAHYGNPSLKPEVSTSIEAQIGYLKKGFLNVELTFFRTEIENVISYQRNYYYYGEDPLQDFDSSGQFPASQLPSDVEENLISETGELIGKSYAQQQNGGKYLTTGVEFMSKLTILDDFYLTFRMGYNITSSDSKRLNYGQKYFGFVGLNYRLLKQFNFNVSGRYVGDKLLPYRRYAEKGNPYNQADDTSIKSDAYFVFNASVLADDLFTKGFSAGLKFQNILNQEYYEAGKSVLYPQTRFRFLGTVQYKF